MFDVQFIPADDGQVAIYIDDQLFRYGRDADHARALVEEYTEAVREAAPIVWRALEALWNSYPPELRARLNAGLGFPPRATDRPKDPHLPGE